MYNISDIEGICPVSRLPSVLFLWGGMHILQQTLYDMEINNIGMRDRAVLRQIEAANKEVTFLVCTLVDGVQCLQSCGEEIDVPNKTS